MALKDDFQAAAVEIFNSFESLLIAATYIEESSAYAAGGNLGVTSKEYSIRLLRDTKNVTLTLSGDIPWDSVKYMLVTKELPVQAKAKDKIRIGAETRAIIAVEDDPADAITVIYVG